MEDSADRQFGTAAINYASFAFSMTTIFVFTCMTFIQYFLLKANRSKTTSKAPTSFELCLLITAFWTTHRILDQVLIWCMDKFASLILLDDDLLAYYEMRRFSYGVKYWTENPVESTAQSGVLELIFYDVLLTWLISQSIVFILDTIIPLFRDIRKGNQEYVVVKLISRTIEILGFIRQLYEKESPNLCRFPRRRSQNDGSWDDKEMNSQLIRLEQMKSEIPEKGQRALSWDLTVDKAALDEMKETLGPPGGFGELGFNVSIDRVCFGAMGVGTRFELTFVLEASSEAMKDERRRKSH